ncbi:MAG: hypothetical protein WCK31_00675 [bacterium]
MQLIKQLRKNNGFSIIEIIIALVFSSIILTTFISLSAWGLNIAKDNEIEDTANQSMIEVNDLLRSQSDITTIGDVAGLTTTTATKFFRLDYSNADARNQLIQIDDLGFTLDSLDLDSCRENTALQVKYSDSNSIAITTNVICVVAMISKLNENTLDNRYVYTVKVIAEKANNVTYKETIDGMRVGNFIAGPSFGI